MSLYKKCEVCGAKINKLQNISNIFLLGFGKELICKNCKSKYGVSSKIVEWIYAICFENLLAFPPIVILIVVYFGGYFSKYGLFEMILCILITIFLTRKSINIILLLFCKFKRLENEKHL